MSETPLTDALAAAARRRTIAIAVPASVVEAVVADVDRELIETIADARRIFQALCTERDRLGRLIAQARSDSEPLAIHSPAENARKAERQRQRMERLSATRDHTVRLIDEYASALAELPATSYGCPCVVLPTGHVYACDAHYARATVDGHKVVGGERP